MSGAGEAPGERVGHLLQGRYKAILIQKDSHLLEQKKKRDIPEIPRSQRYAHRPTLVQLFAGDARTNLRKRRAVVIKAVEQYGYRVCEIAAHMELHDSSVSRIARGER